MPLRISGSATSTGVPHRRSTPSPGEDRYEWMLVGSEGRPDEAQARCLQTCDTLSGAMVFNAATAC